MPSANISLSTKNKREVNISLLYFRKMNTVEKRLSLNSKAVAEKDVPNLD